jgi:hypothetical protein
MRHHPTIVAAMAAVLALGAGAARADADNRDGQAEVAAATMAARPVEARPAVPATAPARDAVYPTVRRLDAEGAVTGAEPDPETFDRSGLDRWWQDFQKTLQRAE